MNMKKQRRPVMVTTEFRTVHFGYAKDTDGKTIKLKDARNCMYWSSDIGGLMGLASIGPSASCRIGATADVTLRKITAVHEVTAKAEAAWLKAEIYVKGATADVTLRKITAVHEVTAKAEAAWLKAETYVK
jgi:hypothetical protein